MTGVVRFMTKQQQIERQASASIAEQLSLLSPELLEQLPMVARMAISRATYIAQHNANPEEGLWPGGFSMLSREQTALVWDAIRALPADDRPGHVRHAFDLVLLNLRKDTGEVMLTREQLAEQIGCQPRHVSTIMGTLERMGAVFRRRQKVEGLRGPGMAVYFLNPHVGWNGSLEIRKAEAAKVSSPGNLLRILEGGKTP